MNLFGNLEIWQSIRQSIWKSVRQSCCQSSRQSVGQPIRSFWSVIWSLICSMNRITCLLNEKRTNDCLAFLYIQQWHLLLMTLLPVAEHLLREQIHLLPHRGLSRSPTTAFWCGVIMAIAGQTMRSSAILCLKKSFSHYIVRVRMPEHKLVTDGLFRYSLILLLVI